MTAPAPLTRQGVRNLDTLGRPPRRGHVGRPRTADQRACAHIWLEVWDPIDDYGPEYAYIRKCRVCGYVEAW